MSNNPSKVDGGGRLVAMVCHALVPPAGQSIHMRMTVISDQSHYSSAAIPGGEQCDSFDN